MYKRHKESEIDYNAPLWRLTVLCQALNIHPNTVYRWVEKGLLPQPVRVGERSVFFNREAVLSAFFKTAGNTETGAITPVKEEGTTPRPSKLANWQQHALDSVQ